MKNWSEVSFCVYACKSVGVKHMIIYVLFIIRNKYLFIILFVFYLPGKHIDFVWAKTMHANVVLSRRLVKHHPFQK